MTRLILYVRDVALLKNFYQEHFGLSVITEEIENEWVVFDAGGVELALHLVGEAFRAKPAGNHSGTNAKFVFTISSDLAQHRDKLAGAGVAVQSLKRYDGFDYAMYDGVDPEGNIFQVMKLD
ncbi:putative enzyme related to lactoylglutathione lyase [Variovorax boronicumulans]